MNGEQECRAGLGLISRAARQVRLRLTASGGRRAAIDWWFFSEETSSKLLI
jgi:hypothetical protein